MPALRILLQVRPVPTRDAEQEHDLSCQPSPAPYQPENGKSYQLLLLNPNSRGCLKPVLAVKHVSVLCTCASFAARTEVHNNKTHTRAQGDREAYVLSWTQEAEVPVWWEAEQDCDPTVLYTTLLSKLRSAASQPITRWKNIFFLPTDNQMFAEGTEVPITQPVFFLLCHSKTLILWRQNGLWEEGISGARSCYFQRSKPEFSLVIRPHINLSPPEVSTWVMHFA